MEAKNNNIGVDVASAAELQLCLALGIRSDDILAGGIKSKDYLIEAIKQGCTICMYTESERILIKKICEERQLSGKIKILIRVKDIDTYDRVYITKQSKFGIDYKKMPSLLAEISRVDYIDFLGLHHHSEERDEYLKANECVQLLSLFKTAYTHGMEPTILNIGGGFRIKVPESKHIHEYFLSTEKDIIDNKQNSNRRGYSHGIHKSIKGTLQGREQAIAKHIQNNRTNYLETILLYEYEGKTFKDHLQSWGISLHLEPGSLLTMHAGVSCLPIIGYNSSNLNTLLYTQANIYNLSVQMKEIILDPIVLHDDKNTEIIPGNNFILTGNTCREEDILMRRCRSYDGDMSLGDILCIRDTAGYQQGFEDASPHLLPQCKSYSIKNIGGTIFISS